MAPLTPEAKAALLKRLVEGRAKTKAARAEAKEKGLPDPKPRKVRKDKKVKADKNGNAEPVDPKEAIVDPLADKPAREGVRPIDAAKTEAVNAVAAAPVDPEPSKSTKIDVPNLPDAKGRSKIVKDAEVLPEVKAPKALSTTGKTKKIDDNVLITTQETGNQAITNMMPGQKASIKKLLKKNKAENTPEAPVPVPVAPEVTTKSVIKHVPDVKAIEARAPFSFSAIRKALYQ